MDSDAEGLPSEFFDYFKVLSEFSFGNTPLILQTIFGAFSSGHVKSLVKFFLLNFAFISRFYAFKAS